MQQGGKGGSGRPMGSLGAVAHNVRLLKGRTPAVLMAVVKADGFGHGAVPVARTALANGARRLGVSFTAEALALCEAGSSAPTLVWMRLLQGDLSAELTAGVGYDLVRLGIGLYGIEPVRDRRYGLRSAMTLRSRVIATRRVDAIKGVSCGHGCTTERPATLALIPIGYADGLPRAAVVGARISVGGERCPVAGPISMDQRVVDAGSLPVGPGQEAVVFDSGDQGEPTVADWAGWAGTIPHEVLTGISPCVPCGGVDPVFDEINTLAGRSGKSQHPKIWQAVSLSCRRLLDLLIGITPLEVRA